MKKKTRRSIDELELPTEGKGSVGDRGPHERQGIHEPRWQR